MESSAAVESSAPAMESSAPVAAKLGARRETTAESTAYESS